MGVDAFDELPLPEQVQVTPSRINPWRAPRPPEGQRFTARQLRQLEALQLDVDAIEALRVRSRATYVDLWVPLGSRPTFFVFDCPVLRRRRDGKVEVISPAGLRKWVNADGSIRAGR